MKSTHPYGAQGEDQAAVFLETQGLRIVEKRFLTHHREIDLIARDGDDWVFVEVKARRRAHGISALDAITPAKQKRLVQAALMYMKQNRLIDQSMRFDVVAVESGRIEWIKSAFVPADYYTY